MEVTLMDHMGSDMTVVNAARVSFAKEKAILDRSDERLINYLAAHNHWTPFSHCTATFRIKAPIFVARQLFKHKVGLTENEVSRRYVTDDPVFYQPEEWRGAPENAKQGSDGVVANQGYCHSYHEDAIRAADNAYYHMLKEGVAPEQARMVLPQSMYTEWYWTGSLSAFARVCKLRIDPEHAQLETGEIAKMIYEELRVLYPFAWNALTAG